MFIKKLLCIGIIFFIVSNYAMEKEKRRNTKMQEKKTYRLNDSDRIQLIHEVTQHVLRKMNTLLKVADSNEKRTQNIEKRMQNIEKNLECNKQNNSCNDFNLFDEIINLDETKQMLTQNFDDEE